MAARFAVASIALAALAATAGPGLAQTAAPVLAQVQVDEEETEQQRQRRRQRGQQEETQQQRRQRGQQQEQAQPRQQQQQQQRRDRQRQQQEQVQPAQPAPQPQAQPAPAPAPDAARAARRVIEDRREPKGLGDDDLRRRLDQIRQSLTDPGLDPRLRGDLNRRLQSDRDELRNRVGTRERTQRQRQRPGQPQLERLGDRYGQAEVMRDRRPARSLSDEALRRRIEVTRSAIAAGTGDRARLQAMIEADRHELRSRLHAGRDDRRGRLRRDGGLAIRLPSVVVVAPRPNITAAEADYDDLEAQLVAPPVRRIERRYSMDDIRARPQLREHMPGIEIDTVRFGFNEAFVREEEIPQLDRIGEIIERIVAANPDEVFLIEGHTDAVGSDAYNLDLSRKRAQAVVAALTEFFVIDPDNLEAVGYGERYLKIPTPDEEPENRRVTVRRITPLLLGMR